MNNLDWVHICIYIKCMIQTHNHWSWMENLQFLRLDCIIGIIYVSGFKIVFFLIYVFLLSFIVARLLHLHRITKGYSEGAVHKVCNIASPILIHTLIHPHTHSGTHTHSPTRRATGWLVGVALCVWHKNPMKRNWKIQFEKEKDESIEKS